MKKILILSIGFILVVIIFIVLVNININKFGRNICNQDNLNKQAALVLGAKVYDSGQMSDIFRDRVQTAVGLYKEGKVEKILVSGDHGRKDYDEVNSAKEYLLENGVNQNDIFLDHAGFDTYDSLYRAKYIFQVQSLVIVTQAFHLSRALYIADKLGIESCGVSANLHRYYGEEAMNRRETLAKVKALFDVIFNSKPKYLGGAIPLSGSGLNSWD
ncbi:MAG: ElyC/SanA/YdcF family protein [Patescibacteria group bacterium]|jgi:SanA protein|nr:ElyC/SanA/YdcF family protein [Patescibacteria group bacterium]